MKTNVFAIPLARGIAVMLFICVLVAAAANSLYLWRVGEMDVSPRHRNLNGARVDPWRPLPGCLIVRGKNARFLWPVDAASAAACGARLSLPLLAGSILSNPADESQLGALVRAIEPWRAPLKVSEASPTNRVTTGGLDIPQGADVELTLDLEAQLRAQRLVACLTGQGAACDEIGIDRRMWQQHYEGAAIRAGALLVIDVATGEVEVAASAFSPCYAAEAKGQTLPPDCPPSARLPSQRLWKLANMALFAAEMPGSLAKLPIMLGLLDDPVLGPVLRRDDAARARFLNDVQHSDTPNFLDRVFCRDTGFERCTRVAAVGRAARDLGLNAPPMNLLLSADAGQAGALLAVPAGRMLQRFDRDARSWRDYAARYSPEAARRCAEQAPDQRWSKCRNEAVANLAAELWGQGNARFTPVGVAVMLSRIAAAANKLATIGTVHLVRSVAGETRGEATVLYHQASASTEAVTSNAAALVLEGMGLTHQPGGTAYTACLAALGGGAEAVKACVGMKGVAGKTGTPVFNHDRFRVQDRAALCARLREALAGKTEPAAAVHRVLRAELDQCQMLPFKWYAGVVRDDPRSETGPWRKVIVALVERNWRSDGQIDAAFDRGSNIAAEMVFRFLAGRE